MKRFSPKHFIFALFLALSFFINGGAEARLFDKKTTDDSVFKIEGFMYTNMQWLMIQAKKGSFKGNFIHKTYQRGKYNLTIPLGDGPGTYTVTIYQKTDPNAYNANYSYLTSFTVENEDQRDMKFLLPSSMIQSDNEEIIELVNELTKDAPDQVEGLRQIHHYIAQNVKYDYAIYKSKDYSKTTFDALAAFRSNLTICGGYSNLFAAMARAYGIRTKVVTGKSYMAGRETGLHAWNEVFIEGSWRSVDTTWDAGMTGYKYFLTDEEKFTKNHKKMAEDFL